MKTPQEEAEEWVKRIDNDHLYSQWRYDREELKNLIERILNESGRAELIAVTRAADVILADYMAYFVDWERMANDKTYKPEYPANVLKAQVAIKALRATGKVEL